MTVAAPAAAALPAPLRAAADCLWLAAAPPAPGRLAGVIWRAGDVWLRGDARQLRSLFHTPGRLVFLPVHLALAPDWDVIWLEPRAWTSPAGRPLQDAIDPRLRLGAGLPSAPEPEQDGRPQAAPDPWQALAAAARLAASDPSAAVARLADFARRPELHPALHALALRNLAVVLILRQDWDEAEALLRHGAAAHPEYRELDYLAARLHLAQGRLSDSIAALRRATRPPEAAAPAYYVGSGGEADYRSHALLAVLAEGTGNQAVALHHFLTGVRAAPAHPASVAGLLRQHLPPSLLRAALADLSRLGRREPPYRPAIFDFLLLHRAWDEAERLLRVWPLDDDESARYGARLAALAGLRRPTPRATQAPGLLVEGPFLMHSSVARINRRLAAGLREGCDLGLSPTLPAEQPEAAFAHPPAWSDGLRRLPRRLDLTIRHGWPPDFSPPPTGRLAVILPWEFGAVPRAWLRDAAHVAEFWVPSHFVRGVLARAGVPADKIVVIPNGVDLDAYAPRGDAEKPAGARRFEFLFVGGAIRRKGLDLLLRAWRAAFRASDDVSLVIKSLGGATYYRHLALRDQIAALAADPAAAPVIHLEDEWGEERMPALFRGCDALVLPYRGEGFGLPLAEAAACGKPVIATGRGPAPEFCDPALHWLLEAREVEVPAAECPQGDPAPGPYTWFEPALDALVAALRAAAAGPAPASLEIARSVRATHGWDSILNLYRQRIAALTLP